jgi:tripartite-type tricarboxylate transporter receptor subunit TctC
MADTGWTRRALARAGGAGAILAASGGGVAAAPTIDRPARIVVNFPPGGSIDFVARTCAERLRGLYAPQVVVENRPGAAGRLGIEAVKTAPPDGTAILITPETMMIIYPWVYTRTLRYDPVRDFVPVSGISSFGFVWMVDGNHPARDFLSYVDWVKQRGEVPYASPAAGSMAHFVSVEWARHFGMNLIHVPYREFAQAFADMNSGRIFGYVTTVATAAELHRSGRMRVLATTMPRRADSMPDVPTFAELGFPEFTAEEWFGYFLPAGTPERVVIGLNAAIGQVAEIPEVRAAFLRVDQFPVRTTPAEFAARLESERVRLEPIVRASGYKVEE